MPGVAVHFLIAQRTLESWCSGPEGPPFDPQDPATLNAYFHGAVGPDLGYFPGGERMLSDLAHCHRTGRLTRALIACARTDPERAFAWGWLSHVLADRAIHPWIGRGVGQLTHGSPDVFVDGASEPCAHVQIELGVDSWFGMRYPKARAVQLRPAFKAGEMEFLVAAYSEAYGVAFEEEPFLRSHLAVSLRTGQALGTLWLLHALRSGGPVERRFPVFRRLVSRGLRSPRFRSVALGYLAPVSPERWLIAQVGREVEAQPECFLRHYCDGARGLDDLNLDTGRRIDLDPMHPGTQRALASLRTEFARLN